MDTLPADVLDLVFADLSPRVLLPLASLTSGPGPWRLGIAGATLKDDIR
jgi:hypothetical protein